MRLETTRFRGWDAWTLSDGPLTLQVVPAVGGRLMGIQVAGTELCFVNPDLEGESASEDPETWRRLCGSWSFPLWGGGKTWIAPQSAWPGGNPHRDLDSGPYQVVERWCRSGSAGLELLSPVCRQTGLQLRRRLCLEAGTGSWTVTQTLHNPSAAAVTCGLWDVLMLRRPGEVRLDLEPGLAQAGPREITGMGGLADLGRAGLLAVADGQVRVQVREPREFKLGVAGATGAIEARLELPEGRFRYWRTVPAPAAAAYAHGHPAEVFNAPALPYFEVESHSPLATLPAGGSLRMQVREGAQAF